MAHSFIEAEYKLRPLLKFVKFVIYSPSLMFISLNNLLSTVTILVQQTYTQPVFHSRMKHIPLDYHFIWKQVQGQSFQVPIFSLIIN